MRTNFQSGSDSGARHPGRVAYENEPTLTAPGLPIEPRARHRLRQQDIAAEPNSAGHKLLHAVEFTPYDAQKNCQGE